MDPWWSMTLRASLTSMARSFSLRSAVGAPLSAFPPDTSPHLHAKLALICYSILSSPLSMTRPNSPRQTIGRCLQLHSAAVRSEWVSAERRRSEGGMDYGGLYINPFLDLPCTWFHIMLGSFADHKPTRAWYIAKSPGSNVQRPEHAFLMNWFQKRLWPFSAQIVFQPFHCKVNEWWIVRGGWELPGANVLNVDTLLNERETSAWKTLFHDLWITEIVDDSMSDLRFNHRDCWSVHI